MINYPRHAAESREYQSRREQTEEQYADYVAAAISVPPGWRWETSLTTWTGAAGHRRTMVLSGWVAPITEDDIRRMRWRQDHTPRDQRLVERET